MMNSLFVFGLTNTSFRKRCDCRGVNYSSLLQLIHLQYRAALAAHAKACELYTSQYFMLKQDSLNRKQFVLDWHTFFMSYAKKFFPHPKLTRICSLSCEHAHCTSVSIRTEAEDAYSIAFLKPESGSLILKG